MANADRPMGFIPVRHRFGGEIRSNEYTATTGTTIYIGDPVIVSSTGTVTVAAANGDTTSLGVSATYVSSAAAGAKVQIYDDPNIVYMVQTTNSITTTIDNVFNTANMITYATGSTTTHQSIMELDTPGTSTGDFVILGLYDAPDNAWGEFSKVLVMFNQHFLKAAHAGV